MDETMTVEDKEGDKDDDEEETSYPSKRRYSLLLRHLSLVAFRALLCTFTELNLSFSFLHVNIPAESPSLLYSSAGESQLSSS